MNHIAIIHEKVLDRFMQIRKEHPDFYFVPRKINNKGRLDEGYWFIGNEKYLHISFWDGIDWKEKINNIGFVIHDDKTSKIELSAQDSPEKAALLKELVIHLKGYKKVPGSKNKWFKPLNGKDYLSLLDRFLREEKPVIDSILSQLPQSGITPLSKSYYQKYIIKVVDLRERQIVFGKTNKLTRVTWNTNRWQRPSRPSGKSINPKAFEATHGFGYEEWLLDRTAMIDSYHFGFLQSLNQISDQHVGKIYNITLFTINNLGDKYEVGVLKKVECISKRKSAEIFKEYKRRGWIKKMILDLERENADTEQFKQTIPDQFVNIRFKLAEACIHEEPIKIDPNDVNITATYFKLLDKKTPDLIFQTVADDRPEDQEDIGIGNLKNIARRKKVFNMECEYDPYHDQMQNALFQLLKSGHEGYHDVKIEHGRVDIKAKNNNGEQHYFEIKTDGPRLSIRKALGQIMEYAYYPSNSRAAKLIVIADTRPDTLSIKYLSYLRDRFNLNICYRAFDKDSRILSEPF